MAAHSTIQLRGDVRFNPSALFNFYGKRKKENKNKNKRNAGKC